MQNQMIKHVINETNPIIPIVNPVTVEISVVEISEDNFSGVPMPDDPKLLKVPIMPKTVPNKPIAGPRRVMMPLVISDHLIADFIIIIAERQAQLPRTGAEL